MHTFLWTFLRWSSTLVRQKVHVFAALYPFNPVSFCYHYNYNSSLQLALFTRIKKPSHTGYVYDIGWRLSNICHLSKAMTHHILNEWRASLSPVGFTYFFIFSISPLLLDSSCPSYTLFIQQSEPRFAVIRTTTLFYPGISFLTRMDYFDFDEIGGEKRNGI